MGDGSVRLVPSAACAAAKLSTLMVLGITLAASPALAQSAMTPGGGAMAPQAPVAAPQAPLTVAPNLTVAASGATGGPQKTLRLINNSETDTARGVSGAPTGPAAPKPNSQNQPIPGIDVVVQKKPNGGGGTGGGR